MVQRFHNAIVLKGKNISKIEVDMKLKIFKYCLMNCRYCYKELKKKLKKRYIIVRKELHPNKNKSTLNWLKR